MSEANEGGARSKLNNSQFTTGTVASSTSGGSAILNREAALARMGGDANLLGQLASFFLEDAPKLLDEIQAGLGAGDARAVHHAAHSLKGLASSFDGFPTMAVAKEIELLGRSEQLTGCDKLLVTLRAECDKLMDGLRAWH